MEYQMERDRKNYGHWGAVRFKVCSALCLWLARARGIEPHSSPI